MSASVVRIMQDDEIQHTYYHPSEESKQAIEDVCDQLNITELSYDDESYTSGTAKYKSYYVKFDCGYLDSMTEI